MAKTDLSGTTTNGEPMTQNQLETESFRPKPWRPALAVIAWLLVLTLVSPAAANAQGADAGAESSFVALVNQARAAHGVPPLELDAQLRTLARSWTDQMRSGVCGAGNHICHASPISAGVTHPWTKLGENVGTGPDVDSVMAAFLASPGHRANILDAEFTHIGVGVMWDGARLYTTQRFMAVDGASTPAPEPEPEPEPPPPAPEPEPEPSPEPDPTPAPPPPDGPVRADDPSPTVAATDGSGDDANAQDQPESEAPPPIAPPMTTERANVVAAALAELT